MIWIIVGVVALVLIIVLAVLISSKKKKKANQKLDENINKLKSEKDQMDKKEQAETEKKKEEEAFKNITLTEDVEDEFKDFFTSPTPTLPDEDDFEIPEFDKNSFKESKFDDDFFKNFDKPSKKEKTRDEEFEDFMNQHSFSRRVFDNDILNQIKSLPPKIKAIVLGNIFNKFD